jgi:hypothetical protein
MIRLHLIFTRDLFQILRTALEHSMRLYTLALVVLLALSITSLLAAVPGDDPAVVPLAQLLQKTVDEARLTGPHSAPFHLKAISSPAYENAPDYSAEIEMYWISPDKWRRTIYSRDFQQTVIVNGNSRFEQNSSDYFPKWLNDVVVCLFDVVPQHTLDEIRRLNETIELPDGMPGVRSVKFSPSGTDGNVSASWSARVEFDRKWGVLTWISATGFAADFKEYRLFHNKRVAGLIETFPIAPRGDVKTKIAELNDLSDTDESLFAVPQPTPPEQRIRTVQVPEVEYRKLAINPPAMKWPPVKIRPTSGGLTTYIVTDRTGKVRECEFLISNNMSIAQSTVELVKQWHFKPLLIDGVPVQVETTMTFAFETTIEGEQAKFEAASYYFKRGRELTFPRADGSTPFHLKGTFVGAGMFSGYRGTYEETWTAPKRWRLQVSIGQYTVAESRIDDDHYLTDAPRDLARMIRQILALFQADFPGYAYYSPDTDWTMTEMELERVPVLRVAMAHMGDKGKLEFPRAYFFDRNGLLRAKTEQAGATEYKEFVEFAGKQVPRRIEWRLDGSPAFSLHIDRLEPARPLPDEFFTLPKVKPIDWDDRAPW